jgi:hypothetical protein
MSERLKEAEAALRQARNEQEEQGIRRELKRLREEQLEVLEDIDELQQRMESSENRQRMAEARQQLNQSRSRIRQSTEELEQEMVSRAVTSTTRAQRQLEQMRDEFQQRTSGQFTEQMRNMLNEARQLDRQQKEIANEIKQEIDSERKTLTGSGTNRKLAERIDQQRKSTEELIERMENISEQSDASEPLLSRKLYDTLRKASTNNIDRALEETGKLLRHNFLPQAQKIEQQAGEGIEDIKKGIEEAAESVLGNEADALRLARQQLDELIKQADNEATYTGNAGQRESGEPNQPRDATQSGPENDGRASANLPTSENRSENSDRQINSNNWIGERPEQRDMIDPNDPFTGRYFRQWSDRLRDVEEILNEQDLRDEVARIRDSARAIRGEFIRHGKEPQWDLVRQQIINPLAELRKLLSDKLVQLQSDEALVPIDRDPVPSRFAELVRRYYENLGGGD